MKLFNYALAIALAFATCAGNAQASIFGNSLLSGENSAQDQDREWLLDANYNVKTPDASGHLVIQEGDILASVLFFDTLNGDDVPDYASGQMAGLTALAMVKVGPIGGAGVINNQFTFSAALPTLSGNVAISVYEGSTLKDITQFTSIPAANPGNELNALMNSVTDGTHLFDLTFDGDDDFWTASGPKDLFYLTNGNRQVIFDFGLSVVNNTAGVPIVSNGMTSIDDNGQDTYHDVLGHGAVIKPVNATASNPLGDEGTGLLQSNTNVVFVAAPVPEAASIACWVGLSVAGLFGARRFRG